MRWVFICIIIQSFPFNFCTILNKEVLIRNKLNLAISIIGKLRLYWQTHVQGELGGLNKVFTRARINRSMQ